MVPAVPVGWLDVVAFTLLPSSFGLLSYAPAMIRELRSA